MPSARQTANLFYSTGIPVCILVLKKCKKPNDVLFINAAKDPFKIVIVRDIYRSGLEFFFKRKPELEMSGCSKPFYSGDCFFKNKTG